MGSNYNVLLFYPYLCHQEKRVLQLQQLMKRYLKSESSDGVFLINSS